MKTEADRPLTTVTVFAPAKINLTLHVTGQRGDGYHLLDSLVVFASVGDKVTLTLGKTLSVTTEGPEAGDVPADMSNLVLKVASLFKDMPGASFLLEKNLPVSSGIGGGSADAAAAFRGLMAHRSNGVGDARLYDPATTPLAGQLLKLGADIPVCLQSVPKRMGGVGDDLEDVTDLPVLYAVLLNPRVPVSTPAVFKALQCKDNPPMPTKIPRFAGANDFVGWLGEQRNDLEPPASGLAPEIAQALALLNGDQACLLARMSGSGATCFGLFETALAADAAAKRVAQIHPGWWCAAVRLGSMDGASLPKVS